MSTPDAIASIMVSTSWFPATCNRPQTGLLWESSERSFLNGCGEQRHPDSDDSLLIRSASGLAPSSCNNFLSWQNSVAVSSVGDCRHFQSFVYPEYVKSNSLDFLLFSRTRSLCLLPPEELGTSCGVADQLWTSRSFRKPSWMIDYVIQFRMTGIIQNWMIDYVIQKWMTRIIQNWMNAYVIQKRMTGIIQNWMIIVCSCCI